MTDLQPILIDSGSFPEIRKSGCIYVDKTAYFHRLLAGTSARRFFLARPRRFGKSLMISTLKAIFQGRRDLFEGLAIDRSDWKWEKYPVLHFNFGFAAASTADEFERNFPAIVEDALAEAGAAYDKQLDAGVNFGRAIDSLDAASGGRGVAILIDEYDDPVAQLLDRPDEAERVRGMLAGFYRQMKDRTERIRFLMITGVSKFTKMSVFSALSNLVDLSFSDECATMLGYTEEELDAYFAGHMRAHAAKMGLSGDAYRAELKRWFNGYRFGLLDAASVYNPVSIGVNLAMPMPWLKPCWADTGKAVMLMNYLKRNDFLSFDMEEIRNVREREFDVTDIRNLKAVPMLFQTGYLTLADFNPRTRMYTLRVPDEEVRQDLATVTASVIANRDATWVGALCDHLLAGEWEPFFAGLKALYAGLPYGPTEGGSVQEYAYERCLLVLLKSQAIQCAVEDRQASGQADVVATHPCGVYVFELKVGESAAAALEQVRRKGYEAPYMAQEAPVWRIGLNFDRETHLLLDGVAERAK